MTAMIDRTNDATVTPEPPKKENPVDRLRREALRQALSALPARFIAADKQPRRIKRPALIGSGAVVVQGWQLTRSFVLASNGQLFEGSTGLARVTIDKLSEARTTSLETCVETLGIVLAT